MTQKFRVLVTRRLPEPAMDRLREAAEVELLADTRIPEKNEVLEAVRGKDALLCLLTETVDEEVIRAESGLKVISNYAVGYDNINVDAATDAGIPVTNTPGVLTETTADLAWALITAVARRIVEADRYLRDGRFKQWEPMLFLGDDIHGKTLGIVGCGRIGRATARRARGFDMDVLYTKRERLSSTTERELNARHVELDELLTASDFVSLHVPLSEETRHLINMETLKAMKNTAYLINTARGPIVDEAALVEALEAGEIAGAGLDVFEEEPDVHPGLIDRDDVVLVPHIGSATVECRTEMAMLAVDNLLAALSKERPPHLVNPKVWEEE